MLYFSSDTNEQYTFMHSVLSEAPLSFSDDFLVLAVNLFYALNDRKIKLDEKVECFGLIMENKLWG